LTSRFISSLRSGSEAPAAAAWRYGASGLGIDAGASSTIDAARASCVDPALYVCPAPCR
jgi:hypothetical protein